MDFQSIGRRFRRFPWIKQRDSMQCGVACLTMVCRHYGWACTLSQIEELCHATAEGVSLRGMSQAASELGFETASVRLSPDELSQSPLPAIVHWNQNHFVVLYRIDRRGRYHIADPGKGLITYSREEFMRRWVSTRSDGEDRGIAMLLQPGPDFGRNTPPVEGQPGERRSFRFLVGYIMQYRGYFAQIFLGLLLGCVLQLAMPFLTQAIVDRGIHDADIGLIWLILLGELMIVAGRTATDFIRRWLLLHISMRINISLVSDFFIKLLKLPMSFFDTKLMGDLLQRMSDHSRVQSFLTGQTLGVMFTMLNFIVFGAVLLVYDRLIFTVFIIGSLCYALWISAFLRQRKVIDYELFECQAVNQNRTYQFITTIQEIKLQDCERRRRWEWEDAQADLFEVQMRSLSLQQTQEAGSIFINEVKNIVITVFAATAVINGDMTLGAMLAVQYVIGQLNSPVAQIMSFIYSLQDVKISLERINEIHGRRNEEDDGELLTRYADDKNRSITLNGIDFRYDLHALKNTLDNITFTVPQGQVTAIVGASGSGKTTMIKLMLGYYRVNCGSIDIAGADINRYSMTWWRRRCGVVMQDGVIFSESIARNIAVSDGDIDEARLEEAARTACIHDYIMSLPLRYNTKIGRDGVGLSQGQKQRILIARAVYRNPDYIFLDEATNSLDARNEREIVSNLSRFYRGRTVVVVAHRLSTVRDADNIIVLDAGRIVESGNHDSLIAARGHYYNLVKNQLELGN